MPMVDFDFSGRILGADIKEAYDRDGKLVDVTNLNEYELALALNRGDLTINLASVIGETVECHAELLGFTASRYRPRHGG